MKILKKVLWIVLCVNLFLVVFAASVFVRYSKLTGIDAGTFTLQGKAADAVRYEGEIQKKTLDIPYITNEGNVETRQIVLYRPGDAEGALPLIYIPHYAAEENTADFQSYLSHGWAVASPVFQEQYNGQLTGNDLVFNNAALYELRNLDGIDRQRIAVVGGSAGGYMALMLSELQMGTCATIANSPITNVYYNLYVYFPACDAVNRNSGFFEIPIPIQLLVSKSFRVNLDNFPDKNDAARWAALSPVGQARCFSSPTVINHYTGDILVPVDQITKRYTYTERDPAFPEDFPICMGADYPGVLSCSLEEEADPDQVTVSRFALENRHVDMEMPYGGKLLTINVFDDGPMDPKGSHTAPGTSGSMDIFPYLEEMFSGTLAETERLAPEKLLLLLNRYLGSSPQLPAHTGVDDTVYGSLAVYRQEIVQELRQYAGNHSLTELDEAFTSAIQGEDNAADLTAAWEEIKKEITNQ